jgi:hypothetical protein
MSAKTLLICIALSGVLMNCGRSTGRTSASHDAWFRAPPSENPLYWTWPVLAPDRIHEVVEDKQPEAQGLLEEVAVVELSDAQAAEFTGKPLPKAPGTTPYLVRALYQILPGKYSVHAMGDRLTVHHGALGHSSPPARRHALVLQLEQRPVEVYVMSSVAE